MFHAHKLFVAVACLPALVSASIYPTLPVQATVWTVDRPMLVSWVEDGTYPHLNEMGQVAITLWRDTEAYLVSLASNVDPMAKMCQVTVPGWAFKQGSKYTLRFTTSKPIDAVVYSADFVLVPTNTSTMAVSNLTGTGAGMRSGGVALATPTENGTGGGSGSGIGSGSKTAVPSPTTTGSSRSTWTTMTTMSSVRLSTPSAGAQGSHGVANSAATGKRGGLVDVDKLKFRFVFVMWPVLVGIMMAL